MCGRFTLHSPAEMIRELFGLAGLDSDYVPSYNIAPTQNVVIVSQQNKSHGKLMRWGLQMHWKQSGPPLINARLESLGERPTFRPLVDNYRCIIIADGFYEWKQINGKKQPYYFTLGQGQPFAFAGLWRNDQEPSCTIVTRAANDQMQQIHQRMPVIVAGELLSAWLGTTPFQNLRRDLLDQRDSPFVYNKVSTTVNSPRNNDPSCILPIA